MGNKDTWSTQAKSFSNKYLRITFSSSTKNWGQFPLNKEELMKLGLSPSHLQHKLGTISSQQRGIDDQCYIYNHQEFIVKSPEYNLSTISGKILKIIGKFKKYNLFSIF
jgi:hypothetical protein